MNYEERLTEDARLVILRALLEQTSGSLNEAILEAVLDRFGHRRSRSWVRTQLLALKDLGAVQIVDAGTIMVATITKLGKAHVERREIIDGVARPSPEV
jgi:hypothetical protein